MKKHIFTVSLTAFLLQACQTTPLPPKGADDTPQPGSVTSQPAVEAQTTPNNQDSPPGMTGELLYYMLASEIALQRNQFDVAAQGYGRAAQLSRDARVAERATRIAVYTRDDQQALQSARLWVQLEPGNIEAHQVVAALLVRTRQTELALPHFEALLSLDSQAEYKRYMLITSLLSKEKDKQAALEVMEKLVEQRQNNPDALYALAHLAMLVGNLQRAGEAIDQTLVLKPDWIEAHLLRANILHRTGESEKLIALLREALQRHDDIQLRLFLARKLVDEKQFEAARKEFAHVLRQDPRHVDALYAMGLLGLQVNNISDAERNFETLVSLGERVDEARYYLGQAKEIRKQFSKARDYYTRIKSGRFYVDAQIRVASILAKQGKIDAAREHLQNVSADTMDVELQLYLAEGEILRDARQYDEAFRLYSMALQQMPDNTQLLYARALTAEKLDRLDVTLKDLRQIITNEPNNAEALNALGYTLVDQTDRLAEGTALIERALKLKPEDAAIIDSMGWAYYRAGNYDKALTYLRRAFEMLKDGEIAAHLGEVLWVKGDQAAARRIWEDALRDTPEHQVLRNVIQRFIK